MSRPAAPATGASLIALLVNLGVGIPVCIWAFMASYFMNDLPDADDNLYFLRCGIIAALLAATILVLLSVRNPRVSWRAVAFAAATSAAINGAWLAFFFGSDVENLGDDSGTTYDAMSTSTVWSIAAGCAVAALVGLAVAVWTRPRAAILAMESKPVDPRL
jgi:hypothetical protein